MIILKTNELDEMRRHPHLHISRKKQIKTPQRNKIITDFSETRISAEIDSNDSLKITERKSHTHLENFGRPGYSTQKKRGLNLDNFSRPGYSTPKKRVLTGKKIVEDFSETTIKAEVDSNDSLKITKAVSHVHLEKDGQKSKGCSRRQTNNKTNLIQKCNVKKSKPPCFHKSKIVNDISKINIKTEIDSNDSLNITETVSHAHIELQDSTTTDVTSESVSFEFNNNLKDGTSKVRLHVHDHKEKKHHNNSYNPQFSFDTRKFHSGSKPISPRWSTPKKENPIRKIEEKLHEELTRPRSQSKPRTAQRTTVSRQIRHHPWDSTSSGSDSTLLASDDDVTSVDVTTVVVTEQTSDDDSSFDRDIGKIVKRQKCCGKDRKKHMSCPKKYI